jgi:DNA replication ATP-dependent helicase Dna2
MPGTGKTFTISQIVKSLVQSGKSVLLTSYTHLAVDNILLKLVEEGVDFVRLGNGSKIHPKILPYTPIANNELQTVAQLENFYASKWVVATTCLGINQ